MAEVISLVKRASSPNKVTPLQVLKELIAKVEAGELIFEDLLVIGVAPYPNDMVVNKVWDTDLTLANTVFLLESVKFDILLRSKARD